MSGTLLTITGPTCSGKSTLESQLVSKYNLGKITSFTTRLPRAGEENGKDYYFITKREAQEIIDAGKMAEYIEFSGNMYGILGKELENKLNNSDCVVVVEPNGVIQLTKYASKNKIKLRSVFLTNDTIVLAARFLDRFQKDKNAKPLDYAKRLAEMMTTEQEWNKKCHYDFSLGFFDSRNEEEVVEHIYKHLL